jgi:hypothetical protein
LVVGRSASNTLAGDRPTPRTPPSPPPAAPRDSRRQKYSGTRNIASRISQDSSTEPNPEPGWAAVISTPADSSLLVRVGPASWTGITVV